MIDEKKLIDAIWEKYNSRYNNASIFDADETKLINKVLGEIQKLIDEQPKVGQWIPCSERLPEYEKVVLTCDKDGWISIHVNNPYKGAKNDFECGYYVAWMPLPKPYEPPLETQICTNKECPYHAEGKECPAWLGCGGFEKGE